ncbi:MAG: glycine-rich protein [Bacilli bacterium]
MNSKKGFTLIELIGVMIILSVMIIITVPAITSLLKKSSENEYQSFLDDLFLATEAYIQSDFADYSVLDTVGSEAYVNVSVLMDNNFIRSTINNPNTEQNLGSERTNTVIVTRNEDMTLGYEYVYETIVSIPTYSIIPSSGWAASKIVTIKYPKKTENLVFSYSVDNGATWITTSERYTNVTFSKNGTIIARVFTGSKYFTASTYTVTQIDITKPVTTITVSSIKTDQAIIQATCSDPETGIIKYEFRKDNGETWFSNGANNTYLFTGLKSVTPYNFEVRCTNSVGLINTDSKSVTTYQVSNPTIAQSSQTPSSGYSYATSRVIGITYSNTNIASPIYYFKSSVTATVTSGVVTASCGTSTNPGTCTPSSVTTLVAGTWYKTDSTAPTINYTANGTLYALTSDGTNVSGTATYAIANMDTTKPSAAIATTDAVGAAYTVTTTVTATCSDSESGITKYEYSKDNGSTWVANGTTASYAFTGLTGQKSYTYAVRCTNGAGLVSTVASKTVTTRSACTLTAGTVYGNYDFTTSIKAVTIPCSGTYKLEVWGAQGGTTSGGYGGYSSGSTTLTYNSTLYVVVGGQATYSGGGYNGGGLGSTNTGLERGGGGGATHIGKTNGLLSATTAANLYIVAGGGGGGTVTEGEYQSSVSGGTGGGTTGGTGGLDTKCASCGSTNCWGRAAAGGTQSAGGLGGIGYDFVPNTYTGAQGSYGKGANGSNYMPGGGGGYYGGGAAGVTAYCTAGGGGGSGYIGGVSSGSMTIGSRSGNGYARITLVTISG